MAPRPRAGRAVRLKSYRGKRDFSATPEPQGGAAPTGPEPKGGPAVTTPQPQDVAVQEGGARFVIQEHHATRLHWDLRLERDGVLASWALPRGLPESPGTNYFAARTEDHPLQYLDFAGEIPKGQYGAGMMTIWDSGTYETLKWEPRKVEVALHGERAAARYALFATGAEDEPKDWMIHRMDPPEDPGREAMPERLAPMLARAGALPADDTGWAYEIKWDGVRAIAYSRPGELRLRSRTLKDITAQYPELGRLNRALSSHSAILDGEIVAFDEQQRPSFQALQSRMQVTAPAQAKRLARSAPVTYMIFDLLWLDGHPRTELPYLERRRRLDALKLTGRAWQTPDHVVGRGSEVLEASATQGLEGIVAKRLESAYQPGRRSGDWVKVKNTGRQEFVIGGWTPGRGRRGERIGALLVGVYDDDGGLRYAGRVGTGFTEAELERLGALLAPLGRATSPFRREGPSLPRGATFCEPTLVAEVEFSEWTAGGSLRQPSYKGLRDDKPADQVVREAREGAPPGGLQREGTPAGTQREGIQIGERTKNGALALVDGRELKLSNLTKVLYPQAHFTKSDVIDYYARIAPVLLGHLAGRAMTVRRWPDGVAGHSFYQKAAPAHRPEWVSTVSLPVAGERSSIDYLLIEDLPSLVWVANLAALELHAPLARAEAIERPTALVFDLDPGEPATVIDCCRVALTLHGMFENLGLADFAKTSGLKGLQVYVPLNSPAASYTDTKTFARTVAEMLAGAEPKLVVSRMAKERRHGKVLIDWSQNDRRKTTVCVYSLRAGASPTVSTPLEWDEVQSALDDRDPSGLVFEAPQTLERVAARGDLFAPVLSLVQELPTL